MCWPIKYKTLGEMPFEMDCLDFISPETSNLSDTLGFFMNSNALKGEHSREKPIQLRENIWKKCI